MRTPFQRLATIGLVLSLLLMASTVSAQGNFDSVQIETTQLADGLYMLTGTGGLKT